MLGPKGERLVQFPLNMKWTGVPDMIFSMDGPIQSVAVQGTVYIGGGAASLDGEENYIVMAYHNHSHKWCQLRPYRARYFAMAVINNQLVLVGGHDHRYAAINLLGVWEADSWEWAHPFPPMPTARGWASAITHRQWLVVAGGMSRGSGVATVEVMDADSRQWWSAPSTPTPLYGMRSTRVGDMWYLMGGYGGGFVATDKAYRVSLPVLISHSNSASSSNPPPHMWNTISGLGNRLSTPLAIGGSALAVGGKSVKDLKVMSAIHRYLPETEEWVVVGELPSPLYNCTCAVISVGQVFVAGMLDTLSSRVFVGNFI